MATPDEIEQSLELVRQALVPPVGTHERVLSRVATQRALDAVSSRAPARRGVTKLTTSVLVGAGFVAGYWLGLRETDVRPERAAALESSVAHETAPAASSLAAPPATPAAPAPTSPPALELTHSVASGAEAAAGAGAAGTTARTGPPALAAAPVRSRAALARRASPPAPRGLDELALLSRTERALRAGEAALALSFLDELDRQHPRSVLLEERSASRLLADCLLQAPGASERAERYLHDHGASVYSDRLQHTCALGPAGEATQPEPGAGASAP